MLTFCDAIQQCTRNLHGENKAQVRQVLNPDRDVHLSLQAKQQTTAYLPQAPGRWSFCWPVPIAQFDEVANKV